MDRKSVVSSNIKSVGHDGKDLEIEFSTGKVYRYSDVPVQLYESMMAAESKGKFFGSNIRNAGFAYNVMLVVKPAEENKVVEPTKIVSNVFFVGKAGSGKTTCVEYLIKQYGCKWAKFAGHMYYIAERYFGMKEKDRVLLQQLGTECGRDLLDNDLWVKRLMEDLAMVRATCLKLGRPVPYFVLDDCRFPNECEMLITSGWVGVYLKVEDDIRAKRLVGRDGVDQTATFNHSSEIGVDEIVAKYGNNLITIDATKGYDAMLADLKIALKFNKVLI